MRNYNMEKKLGSVRQNERKESRVERIHSRIDNDRESTATMELVKSVVKKIRSEKDQKRPTFDAIVEKLENPNKPDAKSYNYLDLMDLYDRNPNSDKLEALCEGFDPITIMALMKINWEDRPEKAA